MIRKIGAAAGACVLISLSPAARAVDGIAAEIGQGDDNTRVLRVAITDRWRRRLPVGEWHLAGYWEFSAGLWDNAVESTADVGATPVFRMERTAFYVEAAVGAHLVTSHISAARTFATALQFGSHFGAGYHFGPGERYDLGVRAQHLSNGGIRSPNPGINFYMVRLAYSLE